MIVCQGVGGELRDGVVHEADVLGADVGDDGGGRVEGDGFCGAVAAETDVNHVFGAAGEGDYVDDVAPRGICYTVCTVLG